MYLSLSVISMFFLTLWITYLFIFLGVNPPSAKFINISKWITLYLFQFGDGPVPIWMSKLDKKNWIHNIQFKIIALVWFSFLFMVIVFISNWQKNMFNIIITYNCLLLLFRRSKYAFIYYLHKKCGLQSYYVDNYFLCGWDLITGSCQNDLQYLQNLFKYPPDISILHQYSIIPDPCPNQNCQCYTTHRDSFHKNFLKEDCNYEQ